MKQEEINKFEKYAKKEFFYTEEIPSLLKKYLNKEEWFTLIDIGCGDGGLLYALKKHNLLKNKKIYATDLSWTRVKRVKELDKSFICFVSTADDLKEIKSGAIDVIISTQVIEHVPDDEAMVKELSRILSRKGFIYLSTVFKKRWAWHFHRANGHWALDPTHVREYTQEEQLFTLFERYGLRIIEENKILFKFPLLNFILRYLNFNRNIYNNKILNFFRNIIKIPSFGYYWWEFIAKKQ